MATDEYQTIESPSEGFYKEKGSRFIALAVPVQSIEDFKLQIEKIKKQYHDARHHCYAYRIGPEPYESRQNDDGEPSGTAGKPIYGQIQSFSLTNIMIVVVRYFGGVKLGTGGLIQAYKTSARDAVNNSKIITMTWNSRLSIRFDYINMDPVMKIIRDESARIISQESMEKCAISLEVRKGNLDSLVQKMSSLEMLDITVI
jgi:uncharacterized YigZ family protein